MVRQKANHRSDLLDRGVHHLFLSCTEKRPSSTNHIPQLPSRRRESSFSSTIVSYDQHIYAPFFVLVVNHHAHRYRDDSMT